MINKTLAILAGGQSSRMNYNNKALLKYKEKTFIEQIIRAGSGYKEIIIIANNEDIYKEFNLRVVGDIYNGHGPLGGIHAALTNSSTEYCLCIACDMPLISEEILDILGSFEDDYEVLVPKVNNRLQPLCAIYKKTIINDIEKSLKVNDNQIQKLILSLECKAVEGLPYREFYNINTLEDYNNLR
ncbi:molybdenum cofactor guanylyltransferase [Clostridium estertheticum]|uniref:Probable molybdenum cofactor guanylyltransferase n=1 Tax=Clostridium estertheticum subsp. estertheticum TaxID=1552 RepID=A0A1J0GLU9_9CLOT|nr:molybdenum cofactor guanylyltransferase [Clostridium estertheticum]APC42271.1 molybdenum cofactor guanylyltransferase [Clostridium estertheticum subsp. estertheticum]MBU3172217.1 molybdenum cofactor guanylyltransferase [Clostridium estertheticum]MBZ9615798.1 molybdenum cofactor guanylyltransferase [Clostridium estertheticum subsp. laramiense]WAG75670.1 molybdenum cofactor guanylyltransferase [Clostridium estertheticum]